MQARNKRTQARPRGEGPNLDAVGRVVRGEDARARRRLLHGLRSEHPHGGQRGAARRRGAREEGELVGVGVERAVQEHVGRARGERAQDVARDGRARELEPPRAAHEAYRHPLPRRRGRPGVREGMRRLRLAGDEEGEAEGGGEGEGGGEEEQQRGEHGGQAAAGCRGEVGRGVDARDDGLHRVHGLGGR